LNTKPCSKGIGINVVRSCVAVVNKLIGTHGDLRSRIYFSKAAGTWRNLKIYIPPRYDKDDKTIIRSFLSSTEAVRRKEDVQIKTKRFHIG
jgi:hypothetical protein